MKITPRLFYVAALLAALALPSEALAKPKKKKKKKGPVPAVAPVPAPSPVNTNLSDGLYSVISGGFGNLMDSNSPYSVIAGGSSNDVAPAVTNGVIGGGALNAVANNYATVAGGSQNFANGAWSAAIAGQENKAVGNYSMVGGGVNNQANGLYAVVAGGQANRAELTGSTASGGEYNSAAGQYATVAGGQDNSASNNYATVSGGRENKAEQEAATVGGGQGNQAKSFYATVAGGSANLATNPCATVGGGSENVASGQYSTVPGGVRCKATHAGSFVWSGWGDGDTVSTQTNSFTVRASGGVRFLTTTATNPFGLVGVILGPGDTAWTPLSDRESKTDFQSIEPREVLSKLASMPVTSWRYKHDPSRRYIGPTSQDFMAAFHLGNYDKGINTLDADGVTFAAIQGLVEELKDRDKAIEELKSEMRTLREQVRSALPPVP